MSVAVEESAGTVTGRIVGDYTGSLPGPTLVCMSAMHGNEPAGVVALQRVFSILNRVRPRMAGRIVGLIGNLKALECGQRFIDEDLNRAWTRERMSAIEAGRVPTAEAAEQAELLETLDRLFKSAPRPLVFMDLHTTSGDGLPFALIGDTLRNRSFALHLPVPIILGLEEQLSGTVTEYVNERGAVTVGFESGRHQDPASVDRHEAAVWIGLRAMCRVDLKACGNDALQAPVTLARAAAGLPRIMQVRHRHGVTPEDDFRMKPGYDTFRPVHKGDVLAFDRRGEIVAPIDGLVLLPLYQAQGDDGFFLAEPVNRAWLVLSAILRRIRADYFLRFMPGVHVDARRPGVLVVDPAVARFWATDVFHLFGFRRCRPEADRLIFERRTHDFS